MAATVEDSLSWASSKTIAPEEVRPAVSPDSEDSQVAETVERAKSGSREAFEELVAHFEARIFNYLNKLTGNRHDAEDLAQETFIKVYKNLHRHRRHASFSPWLYTIAKRTALNHFRSRRVTSELEDYHEADPLDPSVRMQQKETRQGIWDLTRRLKPAQQEALWLRYGEGFSIQETARIMKRNQVYVRVLLHRTRNELARHLGRVTDLDC